MLTCPHCSKQNQENYKFCLGCGVELRRVGAPLPPVQDSGKVSIPSPALTPSGVTALPRTAVRSCPQCGADVTGYTFCGHCGIRVSGPVQGRGGSGSSEGGSRPARGKLVLIRPDGSEGGSTNLHEGSNIIGRGSGPIFDADNFLSPRHAELILTPAGLIVRDLSSLNGVFIKLTEEEELIDHDVFRIGQELLRFDIIHTPTPLEDGTHIMGSPNPGYWGRLVILLARGHDGAAFPLSGDLVVLGRERGDILFPEDGYVSGTHARLVMRGGRFYLVDMNSSNGTFLRVRGERAVRSGTYILVGQQLFRAQYA